MIEEREVGLKGIPGLVITSGEKAKGVVLFYHGWSSQKEFQAVRGRILASYGSMSSFPMPSTTAIAALSTMKARPSMLIFGRRFSKI